MDENPSAAYNFIYIPWGLSQIFADEGYAQVHNYTEAVVKLSYCSIVHGIRVSK